MSKINNLNKGLTRGEKNPVVKVYHNPIIFKSDFWIFNGRISDPNVQDYNLSAAIKSQEQKWQGKK